MAKAGRDNRANQLNPNHAPTGPGKVQHSFIHGSPAEIYSVLQQKVTRSKGNIFMSFVTINCVPFIGLQHFKQQKRY